MKPVFSFILPILNEEETILEIYRRLAQAGVRVNRELRPVDRAGAPVLGNVRVIGTQLAGHDPTAEGSREGVALATAARVAALLAATPVR